MQLFRKSRTALSLGLSMMLSIMLTTRKGRRRLSPPLPSVRRFCLS